MSFDQFTTTDVVSMLSEKYAQHLHDKQRRALRYRRNNLRRRDGVQVFELQRRRRYQRVVQKQEARREIDHAGLDFIESLREY
jgi:hypothetical protein